MITGEIVMITTEKTNKDEMSPFQSPPFIVVVKCFSIQLCCLIFDKPNVLNDRLYWPEFTVNHVEQYST